MGRRRRVGHEKSYEDFDGPGGRERGGLERVRRRIAFVRSRTEANGMPASRSYRSARINQNANPPVLCRGVFGFASPRMPSEPFLPVFRQPRPSMIIRTTTPIACRSRWLRRG
jgi:hypothetical protein